MGRRNPAFDAKALREAHAGQLTEFYNMAKAGDWARIHQGHFDWFMFPIEDGSFDQYNVYEDDVEALLKDEAWLTSYRDGVRLVLKAWGWDVDATSEVKPLENGMAWTAWDVRLAKI